jgi:multidrug efflux pump subunit AcrA (membrane-fusion protein)
MGLYVTAEIPGRELEGVYSLPREALSVDGDLRVVGRDGRLRIREVEILRASDERVVVGSGLAPGDRVVVSRLETVTEGMRVRVAGEASDEGPAPPVAPAAEGEPE